MESRTIGRFEGHMPGPLLICIGGMHGNEPAGVAAISEVFDLLKKEAMDFPDFQYVGAFVGLIGNLQARSVHKRFLKRDLNRMLLVAEEQRLRAIAPDLLEFEDKECLELIDQVQAEIERYQPPLTVILDLHTTTATGGVFTIAEEDQMSLSIARGLHVPVILGISGGLKGTTIDYFHHPHLHQYGVVFEAGQHEDPESILRTVSAIINCMRTLSAVDPVHVDRKHDGLLIGLSKGLPKVTRLVYHYKIRPDETFVMKDGFQNFDPVHPGEELAKNEAGAITSPIDGFILMPKYQSLGDDGFFIVEETLTD